MRKLLAALLVAVSGCAQAPTPRSMSDLVFLTREGCVQTDQMRAALDGALKALNLPTDYQLIDLASLKADDARTGYPTPTLLYKGHDVFGMETPTPPFPDPTWRVYAGGVPSTTEIQAKIKEYVRP